MTSTISIEDLLREEAAVTAEQQRRAALTVCAHAESAEDARELLASLGLLAA